MTSRSTLLACATSVCLVAAAWGQQPESTAGRRPDSEKLGDVRAAVDSSTGIEWYDGVLWAQGPGYKASFDEHGFLFTPALGDRAPTNLPLRFELIELGRASETRRSAPADPEIDGHAVVYRRPNVIERYDVLPEGIEQSFTFAERPRGTGDLVVRGRLLTELPLKSAKPDEIEFEIDDVGGVHIEKVVGLDANGASVDGSMRVVGGMLELRLPAEFVERAALPLTLDPLIGSSRRVSSADDSLPDVAYDTTFDRYIIVFHRRFSSADTDVVGLLVDGNGEPVGSTFWVRNSSGRSSHPRVANVNARNVFVVVWTEYVSNQPDIWAEGIHADTAARSGAISVASGPNWQTSPDIGGEWATSRDGAVVVWNDTGRDEIRGAKIRVATDRSLSDGNFTLIASGTVTTNVSIPSISQSNGGTGDFLVVFERTYNSSSSREADIRGQIIDRDLVLGPSVPITFDNFDDEDPAVDGDGRTWIVAFEREVDANSGDNGIYCSAVRYDASSGEIEVSDPVLVEDDLNDDEINAAVCWTAGAALIGYDDANGPSYGAYVHSIETLGCLSCEGQFALSSLDFNYRIGRVAMASKYSGRRASSDDALIAWEHENISANTSNVYYRRFRADDGWSRSVRNSGPCGTGGGNALSSCSVIGNRDYTIRVDGARGFANAYFVLSPYRMDLPCNSCLLVPDLFHGYLGSPGLTTTDGSARSTIPIPNISQLTGTRFYFQWLIANTGGSCFGFDLSDAREVEIQ